MQPSQRQELGLKVNSQSVIGIPVSTLSLQGYIDRVISWGQSNLSKVVCVANVHMLVEATRSPSLANVLHHADLVTPDGMPLVWMMRLLSRTHQDRAPGMDLMQGTCQAAAAQGLPVFFVGSEQKVLDRMRSRLQKEFPNLIIGGMEPLPFGSLPLPQAEEAPIIEAIRKSGAGVVFVCLGCPKQEQWMAQHQGEIPAVMVGIGGVFSVYAGFHKHAPKFIRESGFEWLYRLIQEPQRLWKRYADTIPPFLWMAGKQLLNDRPRNLGQQSLRSDNPSNELSARQMP
jgi:N-acetylglucosaminyldiphosphoundecaprenol N-acetyl-beta-D-mannosaminyltransferase